MEKIKSEEIVKEVYVSESEGSNLRRRPLGKWRDKVKEYKCEGGKGREGGLEWAMRVLSMGQTGFWYTSRWQNITCVILFVDSLEVKIAMIALPSW